MRFAYIDGTRIEATEGGPRKACCRDCGESVFLRCPVVVVPHWVHHANSACVHAGKTGPETDWHKGWKEQVPPQYREKTLRRNGKLRRADIYAATRTVIELQHSPIAEDDVQGRENDYGPNMFWMFDADGRRRDFKRPTSLNIPPMITGMTVYKCVMQDAIPGLFDASRSKLIDMKSEVVRVIPHGMNGPRQFFCHIQDAGVVRDQVSLTCDDTLPVVHPFLLTLSPDWATKKMRRNVMRSSVVSSGKYMTDYCPHGYIPEEVKRGGLSWMSWAEIVNSEQ